MKNLTCCFTGHRHLSISNEILSVKLEKQISYLIEQGIIYYGTGGALGFDTIAALTIIKLRSQYPSIKLILVLPCKEQTWGWSSSDISVYNYILSQANKIVYTSESYYPGCMHKRNRHLVDNSSHCICYMEKDNGGTAYTVKYALDCGLTVYNLAENNY